MKTIKKSADGTVMMVERSNGIAVSVLEPNWGVRGQSHFHDWKLKASGLNREAAEDLFAQLAA